MSEHLGYEVGDPAGRGTGNSRNGRTSKTVATTNGPVEMRVPGSEFYVRTADRSEACPSGRQHRGYDLVVVFPRYDDP